MIYLLRARLTPVCGGALRGLRRPSPHLRFRTAQSLRFAAATAAGDMRVDPEPITKLAWCLALLHLLQPLAVKEERDAPPQVEEGGDACN